MNDDQNIKVRPAAKAGSWYERNPESLRKTLKGYFQAAKTDGRKGRVRALISPHAGYSYSGPTAAIGYKALKGSKYKRVIVLAPSHYAHFSGGSIADVTHYETPLGRIPLDRKACDALLKIEHFTTVPSAHTSEHSLELQLPFLQMMLKDGFELIPIVISSVGDSEFKKLANALTPYWDDDTLVVASSDFTHFGASFGYTPFKEDLPKNLGKLDMGAVDQIVALDFQGFNRYVKKTGATICGRNPIALLVCMANEKKMKADLLHYTTSGAMTGDYATSVSYASICFTGQEGADDKDDEEGLTKEEQETLLKLARRTVQHLLKTGKRIEDLSEFKITDYMKKHLGAFVTLKKQGRLRGCIGYLVGVKPLYETVIDNAISAASKDPRFPPVKLSEEAGLHIEISVLSPVVLVKDLNEINVGRDGLIITRGYSRGTLLPQVPVEYGWTRKEFLEHTCNKAGLPIDAYKDKKTKIERYAAQVFSEPE